MSLALMDPLTSSTSSTFGEAAESVSSATAPAGKATPAVRVASRAQIPAASRCLVIIAGSY